MTTYESPHVDSVIAELQAALEENAEFHHASAINASSKEVAALLRDRARARIDFAQQLVEEDTTALPDDLPHKSHELTPSLNRGFMTVAAAMTIEPELTDKRVLDECQRADSHLLDHYQTALKDEELPDYLRRRITGQMEHIQATHASVDTRRSPQAARIVLGLFADEGNLRQAVAALHSLGLDDEQIAVIANGEDVVNRLGDRKGDLASSSAGIGAIGGSLLGGLVGLMTGIGIVALPGVGAVLAVTAATTILGSAAVGAGIGAAEGSFLGMLVGWGVAEENTQRYTRGIEQGEILLVAEAETVQAEQIASAMRAHNGTDISVRVDEHTSEQP